MPPLTSWPPFRPPHCYACWPILLIPKRDQDLPRSPTPCCYRLCSLTPGKPSAFCPIVIAAMLPSGFPIPSTFPKTNINGAQSLQPGGLQPAASLSTLNRWRYRHRLKTRYAMHWVVLSRRHFQPLADRCVVAHRKITLRIFHVVSQRLVRCEGSGAGKPRSAARSDRSMNLSCSRIYRI